MRRLAWIPFAAMLVGCPADDVMEEETGENTSGPDTSALGCAADEAEKDTTDGATDDVMQSWGAPCSTDEECVALIGEGAVCLFEAVVYELPLGYCSKPCTLPDGMNFQPDAPDCDPDGGVSCIGQGGIFESCAVPCTDDAQCSRDGYICRFMPVIGAEGDPTYCLMPDCCENGC